MLYYWDKIDCQDILNKAMQLLKEIVVAGSYKPAALTTEPSTRTKSKQKEKDQKEKDEQADQTQMGGSMANIAFDTAVETLSKEKQSLRDLRLTFFLDEQEWRPGI